MKNNSAIKINDQNAGKASEQVPITVTALKKLFLLADMMERFEFGVITASSNHDCVIDDIVVPVQEVDVGSVEESGMNYANASFDAADKKLVPLGVAHSHGHFDVFHSSTDHSNFQTVLDSFGWHNVAKEYVNSNFSTKKSTKSVPGVLFANIKQVSDFNLDLRGCGIPDEYVGLINNNGMLKFLKKKVQQVSSIVFNNDCSEVNCIKRLRVSKHLLPKSELALDEFQIYLNQIFPADAPKKYLEYFKREPGDSFFNYCYTTDAIIAQVEDNSCSKIDVDAVVKELKRKITVKSSIKPKIFSGHVFYPRELKYDGELRKRDEFLPAAEPVPAPYAAPAKEPEPVLQEAGIPYVSEPVTEPASEPIVQKAIIPYVSAPVPVPVPVKEHVSEPVPEPVVQDKGVPYIPAPVPVKEHVSEPVSAGSSETVAAFNYVPQPAVPDSPHSAYRKIVDESKTVQDILNLIEGKAEFSEEKTSLEMLVSTRRMESQMPIIEAEKKFLDTLGDARGIYRAWKNKEITQDQLGVYHHLFAINSTKLIAIGHYQEAEECLKMLEEMKRGG